jgi:hypothetical protein
MRPLRLYPAAVVATLALLAFGPCHAEHDIAYVAEHIPEAAMDNRYGTLPVWAGSLYDSDDWRITLQGAAATTKVGTISLDGPLLSAALRRDLDHRWQVGLFGFYDRLSFSSGREFRPLQTLFAPQAPIGVPVDALFTRLDGSAKDFGGGVYVARIGDMSLLGQHRWVVGVLSQRIELSDYRFDYTILAGPQTGLSGQIDFDATYDFVTPFAGLEIPRDVGRWTIAVHALAAVPLTVQGVAGHITGPGFDLAGDTAAAGAGKHFGDPSLTLGLTFTYRPARLTIDLGTLLTQQWLEPVIHNGIDRNLVLSVFWTE